jgi:hypothetical protein
MTSSSSAQGGAGGGQGGSSSSSGMTSSSSAQGGAGGGQGGAGAAGGQGGSGGTPLVEDCYNTTDDDGDGNADCTDTDCAMAAVCGTLVVNEVDYDQLSTDTTEFVEILNTGTTAVDLTGTSLVFINGFDSIPTFTLPLSGTLAAGQYLVAANAGVMGIPPEAIAVTIPNGTIQNGSPDAIAIYDSSSKSVLDAISYEGSITMAVIDGNTYNLVSGNPTTAEDTATVSAPSVSVIRFPNGQDTGDDLTDWAATTLLTPGTANAKAMEICDNMLDDDVDMLADCADPDCIAFPLCVEVCDNGLDDDADMLTDCADPDCMGSPLCIEICDNMMDDDADMLVDCLDPDCNGFPLCVEICDNGTDEDGDSFIDCADMDCDGMPCDMLGKVCTAMVCTCPGGTTELACNDSADNDCDGTSDCADADCAAAPNCLIPSITSVDYPVIAQGGSLVLTGIAFLGSTSVTVGGVGQLFSIDSATQITVAVNDSTPIGSQGVVVTTPNGTTPPFTVTVIELLISELDSDTAGTDMLEFIEIKTGVPGVSLAGYSLVFWNGSADTSYLALDLNSTADSNGFVLLGNIGVAPAPAITWADNILQNGPDAVGIYQALASTFPSATPVTASKLIDALVYDTTDADDPGLLDTLLALAPDPKRVQVDENGTAMSATVAIQRCASGRRDGGRFGITLPTPGAVNTLAPCP